MMQELQINSYFFAPNLRMKLSSDTLILLLHNDISAFFLWLGIIIGNYKRVKKKKKKSAALHKSTAYSLLTVNGRT